MKRKPFAFISYSRKDVEVAKYLQDRIEKYVYQKDHVSECNRPEDENRVRPIFLDLTDLSAAFQRTTFYIFWPLRGALGCMMLIFRISFK